MSARLPDFPWDSLADAARRAAANPGGLRVKSIPLIIVNEKRWFHAPPIQELLAELDASTAA